MHARYCSPVTGRFLSVDPAGESAKPARPQSWNRYSYGLNNPVKYVDPDGQVVETAWDVLSIGVGLTSFYQNVREGNFKEALIDAGGIAVDSLAAAIPVIPGGAGVAIKTTRLASQLDNVVDFNRFEDGAAGMAEALGAVSNRNLKHIEQHLSEFQSVDPAATLSDVVALGQRIASDAANFVKNHGRGKVFEAVVRFGEEVRNVRVYLNPNGGLRTVFIPRK
jgi:hypothetical protein